MGKQTVDEILQQGIHGQKEIKPEERRKFLGTLRERIILVLTQSQVREPGVYGEVEQQMKTNPNALLFLNGNMDYHEFSKYRKMADKNKIKYKIVANKEHETDIGLVLAMEHAIDKEEIYVKKVETSTQKPVKKKNVFSLFRKMFKNNS
jgi:uncharacterized protein YueI